SPGRGGGAGGATGAARVPGCDVVAGAAHVSKARRATRPADLEAGDRRVGAAPSRVAGARVRLDDRGCGSGLADVRWRRGRGSPGAIVPPGGVTRRDDGANG